MQGRAPAPRSRPSGGRPAGRVGPSVCATARSSSSPTPPVHGPAIRPGNSVRNVQYRAALYHRVDPMANRSYRELCAVPGVGRAADVPGSGRAGPGTRITRLATTRYDLVVGPTDRPAYPCPKPVIQAQRDTPSRGFQPMTYVIAEPCIDVKDKSCIEECPVDCIYEGDRMLYIHPDECVDCGACEPVCPVEAIYYEDDVPDQWKEYTKANVDFFNELGSPGGAAKVGKVSADPPLIMNLPPMGESNGAADH